MTGRPIPDPLPLPNLTALRQLGQELEQDRHFRHFFELLNAPCMIYRDGFVAFVNPAFTAILGWKPQDVVGKHWTDLVAVPPPHDEQAEKWRQAGGQGGQMHPIGYNTKSGHRVELLASWRNDEATSTSYGVFFPVESGSGCG